MSRPRAGAAAGLGLAALALVAFWPVVSGRQNFFHYDLRYEHLPVWDVTQKALAARESPFWIDGEYCGHPLLFHQEAPLFYPLTAPLLATGAPVARLADLFSLFHFWLAGFGAYLLLRDLAADETSALFGGVAWMLSARLVQSAIWPNAVAVSALLPFLLLGIFRIGDGRRRSGVVLTAVSGALALLAARPHVLLGAAPILLSAAAAALGSAGSRRRRAALDLTLAALFASALGGPSLAPTAALYPEMSRAAGLTRAERDQNPIAIGQGLDMVFLPVDGGTHWPEAAAYPGALAALLFVAGVVLVFRRSVPGFPRVVFAALLAGGLVGLIFAFGERGPYGLIADLPLLRGFRVPARYLISWSFAVALGAGLPLAALVRRLGPAGRVIAASALGILAADLTFHARRAAPTATADLDRVTPDVVEKLRRGLGRDEVGFPRRFSSVARIPLLGRPDAERPAFARRFDPLVGALGARFGLESVGGGGPALARTEALFAAESTRAMELAGAAGLVSWGGREPVGGMPPDLAVEFRPALPRAILLARTVRVPPERAVRATLDPRLDPRRTAVVEDEGALLSEAESAPSDPRGSVRLVSRRSARVELETDARAERLLVFFDAYEEGWSAALDGAPAAVFRADAAFRGVKIPAGTHRIVFSYGAPGLRDGVRLFLAGALGLALFVTRTR
ncbi:MAG TPA: YfhO family protein [Thermoanaerobaculia bacterium]